MTAEQGESAAKLLVVRGNELYARSTGEIPSAQRIRRLQNALFHYNCAVDMTTVDHIRSLACVNMGTTHWALAQASLHSGTGAVFFNFRQALKHFQEAHKLGSGRDQAWHLSLAAKAGLCWSDVQLVLRALGMTDPHDGHRVGQLENIVPFIFDDTEKAHQYLEIASYYLHGSDKASNDGDLERSLELLEKVHLPLERAQQWGHNSASLMEVCQSLEDRVSRQRCRVLSLQSRAQAEELLERLTGGAEGTGEQREEVWTAVDLLRQAIGHAEGRDLVEEAIALTSLGKVYHQVLRMQQQASLCLVKALELTTVLFPMTFSGEDWYDFARSTLQHYQQERRRVEEAEEEKQRKARLPLIKDEVEVLHAKEACLSKADFLTFIYTTHPPPKKHPLNALPQMPRSDDGTTALKALYRQAVIDYHPDGSREEEQGVRWVALSGEIFRILTPLYEQYKDC